MSKYNISGHTLHTSYEYPGIPIRWLDWYCVDDNYDGAPDAGHQILGTGATELDAIYDWIEQYREIENEKLYNNMRLVPGQVDSS